MVNTLNYCFILFSHSKLFHFIFTKKRSCHTGTLVCPVFESNIMKYSWQNKAQIKRFKLSKEPFVI